MDEKTFFLVLNDGTVYPVDILVDGKTVSKLVMSPPLAQTSIPSIVRNLGNDHIFIGTTVGPSVLDKIRPLRLIYNRTNIRIGI